ncbi:Retrovirus-related Pol polyprotein from transposon 17.6 [Thelohanellus kitauei]|uniref:Retrovirus-related Pol polyprotein from transposon 17.6 n=1 Tax=Thelohanellus kitauei TaxID=669202 RepID=A0A0C2IRC4_THEKT|nr:Retrovirus-related Pol polyprotein from transposon 17.6 [Thelohanellus kitauei]
MKFPVDSQPLHLHTDALGHSLGLQLSQMINNSECLIAFASRKLKPAEMNYSTTDREMLALVWATKTFRHYLLGRHFVIHSDHNPLKYLSEFRDVHNRRARWLSILSEFNFSVQYVQGKQNVVADSLSRIVSGLTLQCELDAKNEQTLDEGIRTIMDIVEGKIDRNQDVKSEFNKKILNNLNKLVIIEGSLYYVNNGSQRLVIPEKICNDLVNKVHTEDLAHIGVRKTTQSLQNYYFWPNMIDLIDRVVADCKTCQKNKGPPKTPKAPLQPIWPDNAFTDWHVDFMGPLPVTSKGNRYAIIFVDRCTKWVEAFPLADQTALEAAHCFVKNSLTFWSASINSFGPRATI